MTAHHRIFLAHEDANMLIVQPCAEGMDFRYSDLQMEMNSVRRILERPEIEIAIFDLELMNYFGSEMIGAIVQLARAASDRGRRVALCNCSEKMREVLENLNLARLWPRYDTRAEAIAALKQA